MALAIHLLGAPRVERDERAMPAPRGHKAWGLLAYLLLAPGPVTRRHICSLLFADAEDPLAALRWNLSALRRVLGDPAALRGDPLALALQPDDVVDARELLTAASADVPADAVEHELLATLTFSSCPAFEVWLETERRHLRGAAEALLHEAALSALGAGDGARAADLAGRLVQLNPYDENFQVLLVRALASAGHGVAAARQVAACRELFRRDLGVEPGPALAAAAATVTATPVASATSGLPGVNAQIEAGTAAITAGAVDAGLQCLRRAVDEAAGLGDSRVSARALVALGSALVHAVRGQDEEGAAALHAALASGADGDPAVVAEACRELGYVEFLAGRYERVDGWLRRAEQGAGADTAERARVLTVRGSALSDVGRYPEALQALAEAAETAEDPRQRSYALSMIGRAHLLRGEIDTAADTLDESIDLARRHGWTAFGPWPESFRAEADLTRGELDAAEARLERAFAMSCHLGDPCWEGASARGLGLVHAARGEVDRAVRLLADARRRSTRLPDAYLWLDAYTLDAMCVVASEHGLAEGARWAAELSELASRTGMRELATRALVHRAVHGDADSAEIAAAQVATIDNPVLAAMVARV